MEQLVLLLIIKYSITKPRIYCICIIVIGGKSIINLFVNRIKHASIILATAIGHINSSYSKNRISLFYGRCNICCQKYCPNGRDDNKKIFPI